MHVSNPHTALGYALHGAVHGFAINLLAGLTEIYIDGNGFGIFWVLYALPATLLGSILYTIIYFLPGGKKSLWPITIIIYVIALYLMLRNSVLFV